MIFGRKSEKSKGRERPGEGEKETPESGSKKRESSEQTHDSRNEK